MSHRILMLTCQYLPEVFGGAEQQCKRLSEELAARGNAVTILTSCTDPVLSGERQEGSLTVMRFLVTAPPQAMGREMLSSIHWAQLVRKWMRQHRSDFDLIHCHQAKFNAWVGTRAGRELGKPCLVKVGNAGDRMDLLRLSKKRFLYGHLLANSIKRNANRFVAISTDMENDLVSFGVNKDKITYIANGIRAPEQNLQDASGIRQRARLDLGLPAEAKIFLFAGRLGRQKNVATLIDAFGQIAAAHTDALLLIAGAGEEERELMAQAARSIPEDQIRFLGRQENMWPLYGAADCFVLPALAEGLSNALLEAQVSALPVIATAVSGTRDFVTHGNQGFLFEPQDVPALAAHLSTILAMETSKRRAMGKAGQEGVLTRAAIDKVAERYEALYAELLDPVTKAT